MLAIHWLLPYFHPSAHLQLQQDPEKKGEDRFIGCDQTPRPTVEIHMDDNEPETADP